MELEERIKPALSFVAGQTLSTEEFQELLSTYLEENGIVDDLRAHLRTNMIRVLTYTNLGKSILQKKQTISPKINALNLLIAEYLMHCNHFYTLSVMSSEVPLDHSFPPMSINDYRKKDQNFSFGSKEVWDIFEAFNITKVPNLAEKLSGLYKNTPKEPMLVCILQNIQNIMENFDAEKTTCIRKWLNKYDLQSMDLDKLTKLLKEIGIDMPIILQVIQQIQIVITNEVNKLMTVKENEIEGTKRLLNYETTIKLQKFKTKFANLETYYKKEKMRLEMELQQTRDHLRECTESVQTKCKDINELNEQMKKLEERLRNQELNLRVKENAIQQRQGILDYKEMQIDKQFETLKILLESKQDEVNQGSKILLNDTEGKVISKTSIATELAQEDKLNEENHNLKKSVKNMEDEISTLKEQNLCYQTKIQELLSKTNSLMAQLETRNGRNNSYPGTSRPSTSYNYRPRTDVGPCTRIAPFSHLPWPSLTTRSKCSRLPSISICSDEGSTSRSPRENRRKRTTNLVINDSTSGDVTPTEEILNEAKDRLLELERESTAIDTHYQHLQSVIPGTNANNFMHSIQNNMAILRDGLSRIFGRDTKHDMTRANSATDFHTQNQSGREFDVDELEKQAIVEFEPAPVNNNLEEEALAQFANEELAQPTDTAANAQNSSISSGFILNTSLSSIELSQNNECSGGDWLDID